MASLMELVIVQLQFLEHPENKEEHANRELNALFAMNAGLSIMACMDKDKNGQFFCDTKNANVDEWVEKMIEDHKLWLQAKRPEDMPVFINAQFYECIEALLSIPVQVGGFGN